jgi:hypothetical protein|tara:strand:- start:169 stop:309 length:141 start_codon:yes stop_codon:yes gene_type:complete
MHHYGCQKSIGSNLAERYKKHPWVVFSLENAQTKKINQSAAISISG